MNILSFTNIKRWEQTFGSYVTKKCKRSRKRDIQQEVKSKMRQLVRAYLYDAATDSLVLERLGSMEDFQVE